MNVFVTTVFRLPNVNHNAILKLIKEGQAEKEFCQEIKKGTLKRQYTGRCSGKNGIEEVKSRGGKKKFLVSDCFEIQNETRKIPCWWCRERQGSKENGIPLELGENFNSREKEIKRYGFFCDDGCMYAFALEKAVFGSPDYVLYKKACENAEMLHALKNTKSGCLVAANSWTLLKSNGGTLDYDMWKDETLSFQILPGYNYSNVSFAYLQS